MDGEVDEFLEHELLDRTYLFLDQFHRYVLENEAVEQLPIDDELLAALEAVGEALAGAYKLLGERYLG